MEFSSLPEEEKWFPHQGISLEEARLLRYLVRNIEFFNKSKVVQMSLVFNGEYIYGNGCASCENDSITFESFVYRRSNGYRIITEASEVLSKKRTFSLDDVTFLKNSLKIRSKIEKEDLVIKKIPYPEENLIRK